MKTQEAYKVVSQGYGKGEMVSAFYWQYRDQFVLKYVLNKKTTPKIGKIFVFETLDQARNFKKLKFINGYILKGQAEEIKTVEWVCGLCLNIEEFWLTKKSGDKLPFVKDAPNGTLFCDSFTPTEIVKDIPTE